MFDEESLLPISALQHLLFCERQCALIHVEQMWEDNRLTAEGTILHRKVHETGAETRKQKKVFRSLQVRSYELGIVGFTDVVEFHAPPGHMAKELSERGFWTQTEALRGWRVLPVEYKRGRRKRSQSDRVQLCAQALCIEEMLSISIPEGRLYYGEEEGRITVSLDKELRRTTAEACYRLREVLSSELLPRPVLLPHCKNCSLNERCLPAVTGGTQSVAKFMRSSLPSSTSKS